MRENAYRKGEANMTATSFCQWVNNDLLPSYHLPPNLPRTISLCTATRWLHKLGFRPQSHKKGAYVDGHERGDVVKSRKEFLKKIKELKEMHLPPPSCSLPHLHQMPRQEKTYFSYTMTKVSSTPMKVRHGCGQAKMHQIYNQRQKALASWSVILLTHTPAFCDLLTVNMTLPKQQTQISPELPGCC